MSDSSDLSSEFLQDCLKRIINKDPNGPFDLAQFFASHIDENKVGLILTVVEALSHISAQAGSKEAETFLDDQWPNYGKVIKNRLLRRGFQ